MDLAMYLEVGMFFLMSTIVIGGALAREVAGGKFERDGLGNNAWVDEDGLP